MHCSVSVGGIDLMDLRRWPCYLMRYAACLAMLLGMFFYVPMARAAPVVQLEIVTSAGAFDITSLRGIPVVFYVWGDWCRACQRSTPEVLALARQYPQARFVFINTDQVARSPKSDAAGLPSNVIDARVDAAYFGENIMRKKGFHFSQLGLVFGVPAYFLLDAKGEIAASGNGSRYPAVLAEQLARLFDAL